MNLDTDVSTPDLTAIAGAVVTIIAAFLPWLSTTIETGPVDVNQSVSGLEQLGYITLFLGVVVLVALLLDIDVEETLITGIAGLITLIVGLWEFVSIEGATDPGMGLYLTIVGGLIILGAGIWAYGSDAEHEYNLTN